MPIIGTTRDTHYAQGALPPRLGDNAINGTHCQRFSTKYRNRKWNRLAICESDYLTHYVQPVSYTHLTLPTILLV